MNIIMLMNSLSISNGTTLMTQLIIIYFSESFLRQVSLENPPRELHVSYQEFSTEKNRHEISQLHFIILAKKSSIMHKNS